MLSLKAFVVQFRSMFDASYRRSLNNADSSVVPVTLIYFLLSLSTAGHSANHYDLLIRLSFPMAHAFFGVDISSVVNFN